MSLQTSLTWKRTLCAGLVAAFCFCPGGLDPARADTVVLKDKRKGRSKITGIYADRVVTAGKKALPRKSILRIDFSAEPVVAKPDGIVLKDGSVLSGVFHKVTRESVRFRSTSLGPLELPFSRVSAFYFGKRPEKQIQAPAKGSAAVHLQTGKVIEGRMFAVSDESILIREKEGLRKALFKDTVLVRFSASEKMPSIVLRNGERIGIPVAGKGKTIEVKTDKDSKATLTVDALKQAAL